MTHYTKEQKKEIGKIAREEFGANRKLGWSNISRIHKATKTYNQRQRYKNTPIENKKYRVEGSIGNSVSTSRVRFGGIQNGKEMLG